MHGLASSLDERLLVSSSDDGWLIVRDVESGAIVQCIAARSPPT